MGAIYDPVGDRMVIFGGHSDAGPQNLTRELTFSGAPAWNDLAYSGTPPPARWQHVAVYDPTLGRMLIYGGVRGTRKNDVWELSLGGSPAWNQITPGGTLPPPSGLSSGMFDAGRNRLVVVGSFTSTTNAETWVLDLSAGPTWAQLIPGGVPPSRRGGAVIYDAANDRMLHYGGSLNPNELWALSFAGSPAWAQIAPWGPTPLPRTWFAYAYDPPGNRIVMFGGWTGSGKLGDQWTLSLAPGGQWAPLAAAGTPPPTRGVGSMIYDPVRQRTILFGGNGPTTLMNDVWALSLNGPPVWTELSPAGTPPPARQSHTAIYDPVRDRMIVYGGAGGMTDVWALSLSGTPAWTQLFPGGTAPALERHCAIYDPGGDRMIVFGGYLDGGTTTTNRVWELSLGGSPAWTELAPTGTPPLPNESQAAIYDSNGMRMVACIYSVIYELSLGATPAWRELALDGDPISVAFGHGMVFYASAQRVTIIGGQTLGMPTRFIDLNSGSTAVEASLVSAEVSNGQVHLRWYVSGHDAQQASIARRSATGDWQVIGQSNADGTGYVSFTDAGVESGQRYAYRIGFTTADGLDWSSASWVDVPLRAELALAKLTPNPSNGPIEVTLALPRGGQAKIEVLDLAGRIVATRALDGLAPGESRVQLWLQESEPPGLYVVRLSQGGRAVTRRLAVIR
jgi:hypothetical protein